MLTKFLIPSLISYFKAQQPLEQLPSVTFCWVLCVIPLAAAILMLCCRTKKSGWHLEEFWHTRLLPVKLVASLFQSGCEQNRQWTELFFVDPVVTHPGCLWRLLRWRWREHRKGQRLPDQQRPQLEEEQVPPDVHGRGTIPHRRWIIILRDVSDDFLMVSSYKVQITTAAWNDHRIPTELW